MSAHRAIHAGVQQAQLSGVEPNELRRQFGDGRWRKLKGVAHVRIANGITRTAEVHWYEAEGIGRKKMKIKRFLS